MACWLSILSLAIVVITAFFIWRSSTSSVAGAAAGAEVETGNDLLDPWNPGAIYRLDPESNIAVVPSRCPELITEYDESGAAVPAVEIILQSPVNSRYVARVRNGPVPEIQFSSHLPSETQVEYTARNMRLRSDTVLDVINGPCTYSFMEA